MLVGRHSKIFYLKVSGWKASFFSLLLEKVLEEEGVCFKANGRVDMKRYLWEPPTADQL